MQAMQIKMVEVFPMNATLQIPVYQRNYDWRQEQCEKLFSDIETIADKGGTHFLGAIVYKDKKISGMFNELIIVDGQQRITSLILLARALYDSTEDKDIRYAIQANFFRHAVTNPKYPFKLQPTKYDVDVFKKLIGGEELNAHEKSFRLYESYKIFKEKISKSKFSVEQIHNALYSLEFVRMILDGENPQQIFESLNSTGKSLTETELIRNYLLMNLDDDPQEFLYNEYWLPMERLFPNSETVDKFVLHYLIYKRRSNKDMREGKNTRTSTTAMYETFKKYFRKKYGDDNKTQQVEKFLQDLLHYAEFYRHLLFTKDDKYDALSPLDKKFCELIYLIKAGTSPIILMYLQERYEKGDLDAETFLEIADILISCKFRARVCNATGFDDEQTNANIANRLDSLKKITADSFWKVITYSHGNNRFPGDEEFAKALTSPELKLSLKTLCQYLLYSFERHLNHSYNFAGYDNLDVELVMPDKPKGAWEKYLHEKIDSTPEIPANALGNLALVTNKNKPSASFAIKRAAYATSEFSYTRDLARFSDWTSKNIRSRTRELMNLALKIWALPEKYQPLKNVYNLDSDFSELTNTTPDTLSIADKEIQLPSWIDLLRIVAKNLYALDKDNFKRAVQISGQSRHFSTTTDKLTSPFQLDENYYLDCKYSVKTLLSIAKDIVESFDQISGTNFKDEIEFTKK